MKQSKNSTGVFQIEKIKSPDYDLTNLEKYIFNTILIIIFLFAISTSFYRQIPALQELSKIVMYSSYIAFGILFVTRILSYQNKTKLVLEDQLWTFYQGNRKYSFELSEISSIKKSFSGIYSSFVIKIKNIKIRIPAETKSLADFIANLSGNLSKEQVADFQKFHNEAQMISYETEKISEFMKIFCFLIPIIAFFVAQSVWGNFNIIISILWVVLSLVFPLVWTTINLFLLKITASNFTIFSRISNIWAIFGILIYMILGIIYRNFYLWVVYMYRG